MNASSSSAKPHPPRPKVLYPNSEQLLDEVDLTAAPTPGILVAMEHETPPPGITAEEWTATPIAVRPLVGALLPLVAQQQHQLPQLQARLADLDARLNQHSQNSSKPPSSDPPSAPPRPLRPPRGRTSGAQPGHPRHQRPD